jgi:putative transposase
MPRRPRIQLDGVPLHIVQRGHHREACFFAEQDYHTYLQALQLALADSHCALHAYALMPNHVHLLLTPKRAEVVPRLIISLGRRYGQHINTHYWHDGPLWDSRYKSSPIDAASYLLTCQRYIELNPVRAALVDDPAHYRWTSYRANALGQGDDVLAPHGVYTGLGKSPGQRQSAYRALFRAGLKAETIGEIRLALNQNQPLGNARFLGRVARLTGERRVARPRGRPRLGAV